MSQSNDASLNSAFKQIRKVNNERQKALKDLEMLAKFEREIGEPDESLEANLREEKMRENKINNALRKRGF